MDRSALNSRNIVVGLCAFIFSSINFHLMYFEVLLSNSYKFGFVVPSQIILILSCNVIYHWFIVLVLKPTLSDNNITNSAFFLLMFAWYSFSNSFYLSYSHIFKGGFLQKAYSCLAFFIQTDNFNFSVI